ncbi:hypothetical protein TWF696_004129 [Orbilia brochopaga]|uniref:Uncharacterized protein n=1 Tax=Orbilia brochopaga TaxID=3140254 RepID=A0AAV9V8E0_9PEZI
MDASSFNQPNTGLDVSMSTDAANSSMTSHSNGSSLSGPSSAANLKVGVPPVNLPNRGPNLKAEKPSHLSSSSHDAPRSRPTSSSGPPQFRHPDQGLHMTKPPPGLLTKPNYNTGTLNSKPQPPPRSLIDCYKQKRPTTSLGLPSGQNATEFRSGTFPLVRPGFPPKEAALENSSQHPLTQQTTNPQKDVEAAQARLEYRERSPVPSEVTIKEEAPTHRPDSPNYVPVLNFSDPDIIVLSDDDQENFKDNTRRTEKQQRQIPPSRIPQTSSSVQSIPRDPTTSTTSAHTFQIDPAESDGFRHNEIPRLESPSPRAATRRENRPQFVHPGMHRRSLPDEDEMDDDRYYEQSLRAAHHKESRRERDFEDYERPTTSHGRQYPPDRHMHAQDHGIIAPSKAARDYPPSLSRGRLAPSTPRITPATPSVNDIDIQTILGDKFRRAQVLEEELARMQSVFLDIDDKLTSISEKDQELASLRDRCRRFQDSLNDNKDKQLLMKDEIDKLRFQLHTAHDEIKRNKIEAEHRLSRAASKQEMSDKFIKQLRANNDSNKEQMLELQDEHKRIMNEVSNIYDERDNLKHRIRERDAEVEKIRWKLDEYRTMLQDQRAGYQDLREDCAKVDEAVITNRMLRANLDDAQQQLERERNMVASLEASLKDMTLEIEKVRHIVNNNHDNISERIRASIKAFEELLSNQEGNFAKSRDLLLKLQSNTEDPDSELFKALSSILTTTDSKWIDVKNGVSKLCQDQEEASRAYAEKFEKWKSVKESLTQQIETQAAQLKEQVATINNLEKHNLSLGAEVEKQKELNQCLVETKNEEQKLMQAKLAEVTHNYELSESNRREFVVRVSLLESSVNTLNGKLKAEREEAEAEKKSLKETTEKYREEITSLKAKYSDARDELAEIANLRQQLQKSKLTETELQKSLLEESQRTNAAAKSLVDLRQQLATKVGQMALKYA